MSKWSSWPELTKDTKTRGGFLSGFFSGFSRDYFGTFKSQSRFPGFRDFRDFVLGIFSGFFSLIIWINLGVPTVCRELNMVDDWSRHPGCCPQHRSGRLCRGQVLREPSQRSIQRILLRIVGIRKFQPHDHGETTQGGTPRTKPGRNLRNEASFASIRGPVQD